MALFPQGRFITFSGTGSGVLYLAAAAGPEQLSEPFIRVENTHARQRQVPESDGTKPIFVDLIFGTPAQILSTGSVTTTPRALTPDDAVLNTIYQKQSITRYQFQGSMSNQSDINSVFSTFQTHRLYQDRFESYKAFAAGDISFTELLTLQGQTFTYISATGLTVTGSTYGALTNCLIREFKPTPVRDINNGSKILYEWTMTLDQVVFESLNT